MDGIYIKIQELNKVMLDRGYTLTIIECKDYGYVKESKSVCRFSP